jgi:dihydroorotase
VSPPPELFSNALLLDPMRGVMEPGGLVVREGVIADAGPHLAHGAEGFDGRRTDCAGALLAPGLVDLRVVVGEPGAEHKETFRSAGRAAAAGGVTTMVVQPNTDPVIDDVSLVDFVLRRAAARTRVRVLPAAAITKGLAGERMAEIGLLAEAGAVLFAHGEAPVRDSRVLRRAMAYGRAFGVLMAHRPLDPYLGQGGVMHAGEFAGRLGLAEIPAAAEHIGLARDLALAELTGGRLLVDLVSSAGSLAPIERAKAKGLLVQASVSLHHLCLNELDVGDYRTFAKLSPPLRAEEDRLALLEAVQTGLIDVIVSAHDPRPAENKRLPFDEADFGAVGLETLLPGLITLHLSTGADLPALWRAASLRPAQLLGLPQGRLSQGAPADLVLASLGAPFRCAAEDLRSKSRNSPFDGRLLQGRVLRTLVAGETIFEHGPPG